MWISKRKYCDPGFNRAGSINLDAKHCSRTPGVVEGVHVPRWGHVDADSDYVGGIEISKTNT